jgi:hypothetical protein
MKRGKYFCGPRRRGDKHGCALAPSDSKTEEDYSRQGRLGAKGYSAFCSSVCSKAQREHLLCFAEFLGRGRSHGKDRLEVHILARQRETPRLLDSGRNLKPNQPEALEENQKVIAGVGRWKMNTYINESVGQRDERAPHNNHTRSFFGSGRGSQYS